MIPSETLIRFLKIGTNQPTIGKSNVQYHLIVEFRCSYCICVSHGSSLVLESDQCKYSTNALDVIIIPPEYLLLSVVTLSST